MWDVLEKEKPEGHMERTGIGIAILFFAEYIEETRHYPV